MRGGCRSRGLRAGAQQLTLVDRLRRSTSRHAFGPAEGRCSRTLAEQASLAKAKAEPPRWRHGRGRCAARGDSNGMDHPPLVDLSALASTRPTSPVVPEGMAGDAALSARLRVTPLRSRHEGIRHPRAGRIRYGRDGPLVKILHSGTAPWHETRWHPHRSRPPLTCRPTGEPAGSLASDATIA